MEKKKIQHHTKFNIATKLFNMNVFEEFPLKALSQEILDTEVIKSLHTKPSKRTKSIKQSRKRALEQQVSADPSTSRSLTTGRLGR